MIPLNSINCPILNSVTLIEASAGTGKTYNIQNLFVRMIMESDFPIESILVVTFTDAATKELKSRIRTILSELNDYFEKRSIKDIERIENLAKNGDIKSEIKHSRIKTALRNFDKSSIFTIHSFCKKMLDENVFTTSSFFNLELKKNNDDTIRKITQNFFRKYLYKINEIELSILNFNKINISTLTSFINKLNNQSNFVFAQDIKGKNYTKEINEIREEIKLNFDQERINEKVSSGVLSKAKDNFSKENIIKYFDAIDQFINNKISPDIISSISKFSNKNIDESLLKKKILPEDIFFNIVDRFCNIINDYKNDLYLKFYNYFVMEMNQEKQTFGFRNFDDLITLLDKNLKIHKNLIVDISQNFKTVLIDEFQDTDALQYSIFSQIFINTQKPTFLIGDPKQAIYSFRGGDIYAYKTAKEEVDINNGKLYTLPTNYRSSKNMVNAVNELYKTLPEKKEFFNNFIEFYPVESNKDQNNYLHYKNAPVEHTLDIIYSENSKNDNNGNYFSINQTLTEIMNLITDSEYQLMENGKSRSILPSDIAILVNTHNQAASLLPYLQRANIPAVLQTTGSVFDSDEAFAINLLLKAINEPANLSGIRGTLTTFLFDITANDLFNMFNDDSNSDMDNWIMFFRSCNKLWQSGSFVETFNFIISETKMKSQILSQENGERKLTNLFHLQELIQKKEISSSFGITGIISWFNQQVNPETRDKDEDNELRLDSDDDALKIMTIHKSKGLEFPIVFCPFLWSKDISNKKSEIFLQYHNDKNEKVIDFDKSQILLSEKENLEEVIRLTYVALTRSKYKVYLFDINNNKISVLKYLFYENSIDDYFQIIENMKSKKYKKQLKNFIDKNHINFINIDSIQYENRKYINELSKKTIESSPQYLTKSINKTIEINSFSSLIKTKANNKFEEIKDYDEIEKIVEIDDSKELNIFNFPAGAKIGSCWHSIFEEISFSDKEKTIAEKVEEKLSTFGILPQNNNHDLQNSYINIVTKMIENVLLCNISLSNNICLEKIEETQKLVELEFYFSLHEIVSKVSLNKLLKSYGIEFHENIPKGFLNGFIDLVFQKDEKYYILDWKSNSLGQSIKDYSIENLKMEMHEHQYNLQYLIYTVALNKFLQNRIPDYDYNKHFGGVLYIFLRGVNKNIPESGVFFDLPNKELIDELSEILK